MKTMNGKQEKNLKEAGRVLSGAYNSYMNIAVGFSGRKKRK